MCFTQLLSPVFPWCFLIWVVRAVQLHNGQRGFLSNDADVSGSVLQLSSAHDPRRPLLTVELMGGLGNQLFQVAAVLSQALDASPAFSVALPDVQHVCCNRSTYWDSVMHKLQPLLLHGLQPSTANRSRTPAELGKPSSKLCVVEQVYGFDPYDDNCTDATTFSTMWKRRLENHTSCGTIKLYGYFQNPAFFARHFSILRHIFWDESSASKAKARLSSMLQSTGHDGPIVSVHYRLGDYDHNGWVLDQGYYDAALLQVTRRFGQRRPSCVIFSDEPQRAWARSAMLQGCVEKVLAPSDVDTATIFHMMSLAQASVIADSTFSYWAAVLGKEKELVVAPGMSGSRKQCWSYLDRSPSWYRGQSSWITLPARTLTSQELLAEEILGLAPPVHD